MSATYAPARQDTNGTAVGHTGGTPTDEAGSGPVHRILVFRVA